MSIKEKIDSLVNNNDVVLFMKGTHDFPQCGFSAKVVSILDHLGVGFKDVDILDDPELREGIKVYSNWPTLPQLYIKKQFVGGCDIVTELFEKGELQKMLNEVDV